MKRSKKQDELFTAFRSGKYKMFILAGGTGSAKTYGALWLLITVCLLLPNIRIAVFRKSEKNLKVSTIPTFRKVCSALGINIPVVDMVAKFTNGSEILFLWADITKDPDCDNAKGSEYAIAFFNEMNQIDQKYINIAMTRVGRWNHTQIEGKKFFLKPCIFGDCNPTNNYVKTEYYDKFKAGTLDPDIFFQESLPHDNPFNEPEFFEFLKSLPENEYNRYVLNNWNYIDDPNQLLSWEIMKPNLIDPRTVLFEPDAMGVDVARYGNDRTVFAYLKNRDLIGYEMFTKKDTKEVADLAEERAKDYGIGFSKISVDVVGVGGGVVDNLKHKGYFVNSYNSGGAVTNSSGLLNYRNKRAQDYWELRLGLENGERRLLDDPDLIKELLNIRYFVKEKVIQIESKEDMKKRIGYSPDIADALVIAHNFKGTLHTSSPTKPSPTQSDPEQVLETLTNFIRSGR